MSQLASCAALLVSGGDSRITPDPATGRNKYGCLATPDTGVIALGSSTASSISEKGFRAAEALLLRCEQQLATASEAEVYRQQMDQVRGELLTLCGCAPDSGVEAVIAASGTDMHLLIAQLLQLPLTLMIDQAETGSGLAAALRGQHFSKDSTCRGGIPDTASVSNWQGSLQMLPARDETGQALTAGQMRESLFAAAEPALAAGRQILCILTDVSKTGLIFPDIASLKALQQQWPQQVHVLVDACQFRIAQCSLQAYLRHDFMVALTGSKFLAGPTFSGALLLPAGIAATLRSRPLPPGAQAYSVAGDWPASFAAAQSLPQQANFGLLLRWEAALAELRDFVRLDEQHIRNFLSDFKQAVLARLRSDPHFSVLPNPALDRSALHASDSWDAEQSIFPFLLYRPVSAGNRQVLNREQTMQMYLALQQPSASHRHQLGQPVLCGLRDGIPVSALRLCVSAAMLSAAHQKPVAQQLTDSALAALDQLAVLIDAMQPPST